MTENALDNLLTSKPACDAVAAVLAALGHRSEMQPISRTGEGTIPKLETFTADTSRARREGDGSWTSVHCSMRLPIPRISGGWAEVDGQLRCVSVELYWSSGYAKYEVPTDLQDAHALQLSE